MAIPSKSEGGCSNASAVLNVVMTCVGVGIVTLPSVFSKCGMLGGAMILAISYMLSVYSANKLYYTLTSSQDSPIHSFAELGRALFGRVGAMAATINVQVTLIGVCGLLLTICGSTLSRLIHESDNYWRSYAAITAAVLTPFTLLRTMHEIRLVSAFGVATLVGFIVTTLVKCIVILSQNDQADGKDQWQWIKGRPIEYGCAFSTTFLSFFMATSVPSLLKDMRNPRALPGVITIGSGIVLLMYAAICVTCYLTWGNKLEDVVNAMSDKFTDKDVAKRTPFSITANVLMLGTAVAHYFPLMIPVSTQVDSWVDRSDFGKKLPAFSRRFGTSAALVVLTLLIGLTSQNLKYMIGLIGSITIVSLAIYLPVLFYFKSKSLSKDPVPRAEAAFLYLFFGMGVCVTLTTLYEVVPVLIKKN